MHITHNKVKTFKLLNLYLYLCCIRKNQSHCWRAGGYIGQMSRASREQVMSTKKNGYQNIDEPQMTCVRY